MSSEQSMEVTKTVSAMHSLLLTGQFWHNEFADLVNGLTIPTTLIRKEQLMALREWPSRFGLILVCKERRGSIGQELISQLKSLVPDTPIVVLLGSWCEGESRSGTPLTGVTNVYWHQWQGDYRQLREFVSKQELPISLFDECPQTATNTGCDCLFAISALTVVQYEMMADAISALGGKSIWLERSSWQAESTDSVTAVIIDSDSMTDNLSSRIQLAQSLAANRPVICTLGFPRKNEILELRTKHGVSQVVSKPFDLNQLYHAIRQATGIELPRVPAASSPSAESRPAPSPQLDAAPSSMPNQHQS